MGPLKTSVKIKETRTSEPEETQRYGQTNQEEERAKKLLIQSLVPLKTWAHFLGVSERVVQMWAAGTKELPPRRVNQIFEVGHKLLIKQKEAIDNQINELLGLAFGEKDLGCF